MMSTKKIFSALLVSIIYLLFISNTASSQETAGQLFEKALYLEEAQGDLPKAIDLYQKIVKQFSKNREVAAKAQLHIGLCYEKLGKDEAQKAYQRVIEEFVEQHEVVAEARARLIALGNGSTRKDEPTMVMRKVSTELSGPVSPNNLVNQISPDGKLMAYTTWDFDLGICDLETVTKRVLVKNDSTGRYPSAPVFSPDGKFIAYAALTHDWLFYDIYVVGIDGGNRRLVYQHNEEVKYAFPYDWSHDGKHLAALLKRKDGTYQIALVNVADGSSRILKTLDWRSPMRIDFSADDRYLAYDFPQGDEAQERDIFLLATDGSRETTIVDHPANDFLLGWSPDGKRILFASDRLRSVGVWMLEVKDGYPEGMPELIKSDVGQISSLGISRSGYFYYNLVNQMADVYLVTLDQATGKVIVPPEPVSQRFVGGNSAPDWSPDGKYIAFIRSQFAPVFRGEAVVSSRVIVIRSLETGQERTLSPQMNRLKGYNLRWSPDGRSLLIGGTDTKNRRGLHLIDAQTGNVTSSFVVDAYWAEWSRDGKAIYYAKNDSASRPLAVRDLQTGNERILYRGHVGISFALSPDGQQVAFSEFDLVKGEEQWRASLKIMSPRGGDARTLFTLKSPEDFGAIAWSADGNHVLFVKRKHSKNGKVDLWRIAVKGGEPQLIGLEMQLLTQISVHPDGRRIAYYAGQNKSEVWVMENFLPENKAGK